MIPVKFAYSKDACVGYQPGRHPALCRAYLYHLHRRFLPGQDQPSIPLACRGVSRTRIRQSGCRQFALWDGSRVGGAVQTLSSLLMGDPDPRVRRAVARALGAVRSEEARCALQAAALDSGKSVRQAVASALARWEKRHAATQ